jgi:glycosyltransferase involved in cell wall biosynthesis
MSKPLVTAFMPAYNSEEYIRAALESVVAQDYPNVDIVVCDDGSSDGTGEIARSFPQVRVVRQENGGRASACNTAIRASHGEFLTSFDADDLWPPNRISLQVEYLLERPSIGGVFGRQVWMNPPAWLGRDAVFGDLDGIPIGSVMLRRPLFDEVGGFDESFRHGEDMDLVVRLRARGVTLDVLPEVVLYRRYHEGQMTANAPTVNPLLRSMRDKIARERGPEVTDAAGRQ